MPIASGASGLPAGAEARSPVDQPMVSEAASDGWTCTADSVNPQMAERTWLHAEQRAERVKVQPALAFQLFQIFFSGDVVEKYLQYQPAIGVLNYAIGIENDRS